MEYFLVQSYHKEVDEEYHGHLYPCYLTSYQMTFGGKDFGLQSGLHDAIKFVSEKDAQRFMDKAVEVFGETHEFELVPIDSRIFGRAELLYVVKSSEAIMPEKIKIRKVANFDSFAHVCPYFTSEYDVNNGYGCKHPKQDETDDDDEGVERGKCYCWSCPLGYEPDEEDINDSEIDWGDITREDCAVDGKFSVDGEYIVINVGPDATEDEHEAWAAYEQYINRYNSDYKLQK